MSELPHICTTSGEPVDFVRQTQTSVEGQHASYIILSPEERAKGFTRPVRNRYKHLRCNTTTRMGVALAETFARQHDFYAGTFCVYCNAHFPIGANGEFVWMEPNGTIGPKVGT